MRIFRLDPTDGSVVFSIPAPIGKAANAPSDQVRGLTWDGQYLYSCFEAGWLSQIVKINLSDTSTVFLRVYPTYETGSAGKGCTHTGSKFKVSWFKVK